MKRLLSLLLTLCLSLSLAACGKAPAPGSSGPSMPEQVITLVAANGRIMEDIPEDDIKKFQMGLIDYVHEEHNDIIRNLLSSKILDEETRQQIIEASEEFKAKYLEA